MNYNFPFVSSPFNLFPCISFVVMSLTKNQNWWSYGSVLICVNHMSVEMLPNCPFFFGFEFLLEGYSRCLDCFSFFTTGPTWFPWMMSM